MFELNETQRFFEQALRQWCERELRPLIPELEAGRRLPYDLLGSLGRDMGLSAALLEMADKRLAAADREQGRSGARKDTSEAESASKSAVEHEDRGRLGEDPMLTSVLLKELSRVSPGFALVFISTLGCAMAILGLGSAELVGEHALPVLRFEKIGAWALTEPQAGSDAFGGMRTTAVPDGDYVLLRGHKTFISNAPHADVFVVYARVGPVASDARIRPVVVTRGTKGLETGPPMEKMGMHDAPTGELYLDECRVPSRNVLGGVGCGSAGPRAKEALDTLNLERSVMPAMCLGIMERCVEASAAYARTREQFGRPIGEYQGVSFKLARMALALENARNLVFKLAWAQRRGRLDPCLASFAKLYCAEQATRVALDAIQIHGGSGYMTELGLEKLMRDAKMLEIGGGTNEMQLQTIARSLLA